MAGPERYDLDELIQAAQLPNDATTIEAEHSLDRRETLKYAYAAKPDPAPEPRTWTRKELQMCIEWLDPDRGEVSAARLLLFLDFIESFEAQKAPR